MSSNAPRSSLASAQVLYLLVINTFPTEVFLLPGPLIGEVGKDALWCVALGTVAALAPALATRKVFDLLAGEPFDHALVRRAGLAGRAILLALATAVLAPLVNIWGGYGQLVGVAMLVHTPAWAVVLAALAVVVYAVPLDLGTLGRLAQVTVPLGVVLVLGLFLLGAPWFDAGNLLPALPRTSIVWGTYQVFTCLAEVAFGLYLGGLSTDRAGVRRALVQAPFLNGLLLILLTAMPLLIFGARPSALMNAPGISAIRAIHYGFVIERLDTLVQPVWVLFVILKILVWTVLGARLLAAALGVRAWAPIGRAATLAAALLSLRLYHITAVEQNVQTVWYGLLAPVMLLALAASLIALRPWRTVAAS